MKNLKVSTKLLVSFGLILVLMIACILTAIVSVQGIRTEVSSFYDGPYTVRGSANAVKQNFEAMQKYVFRAISTQDIGVTTESIQKAKDCSTAIQAELKVLQERFVGDPQLLVDLQNKLTELAPHREKVLELAGQNKNQEASAYMEANNVLVIQEATVTLDKIIDFVNGRGEEMIDTLNASQARVVVLLVIMGVISAALSVLLCVYITRSIVTPLNEIKAAAHEMSQGNLKVSIDYQSKDEIGQVSDMMRDTVETLNNYIQDISRGMREMEHGNLDVTPTADFRGDFIALRDSIVNVIRSFNSTLAQINQAAEQVASGSDQVSSGAQALSQGATEQASSVEELAATITEISSQVKNNAQNASQASSKATQVGSEIEESNRQMQDMIAAMSEISDKSGEISKIIKTIEDISFQTNILALNAAVEAARAGAAGKGFAVVADEVRNLANKSAEAAKNTTTLIEGSIQAVDNGKRIADATAQSLLAVVDGAKEVATTVDKISEASNEQASSITQVTTGVEQISSVVQTNSATAEESAAASEELSGQAQLLKRLVGQFRLRSEGDAAYMAEDTAPPAGYPEPVSVGKY